MSTPRSRRANTGSRARRPCNQATRSRRDARPLRSPRGSALIADDARPIEIPDAFLEVLASKVAALLAAPLAAHLAASSSEGSPWMTFEEAVQYTRVPAGTFRKLSADGTFAAHGGKRKVYHRDQLDSALLGYPQRRPRA